MVAVGDRVQVPSKRVGQAPRDGVVTGVSGSLLRVTWSGGEESTIFPSMGSVVVVGKDRARPKKTSRGPPRRPSPRRPKKALQEASVQKGCQEGGEGDDQEGGQEGRQGGRPRRGEVVKSLEKVRQAAQVTNRPSARTGDGCDQLIRFPKIWRSPTRGERLRRCRGAVSRDVACRCVR